jgi:hypothetical protein
MDHLHQMKYAHHVAYSMGMMTPQVVTFSYDNRSILLGVRIGLSEVCRGIVLGCQARPIGILVNSFGGLHQHKLICQIGCFLPFLMTVVLTERLKQIGCEITSEFIPAIRVRGGK